MRSQVELGHEVRAHLECGDSSPLWLKKSRSEAGTADVKESCDKSQHSKGAP
jgi:hypothetical protein